MKRLRISNLLVQTKASEYKLEINPSSFATKFTVGTAASDAIDTIPSIDLLRHTSRINSFSNIEIG